METIQFKMCPYNLQADWIKQAYLIKFKRKTKAKIYEYTSGKFRVEIGGLCWDKDTLEECKQEVISNNESFLGFLGLSAKIEIV